jgi:acyl-CoA hydrolase
MKLYYKDIAPADERNGNGSLKGGWIFEKMDYAALTILSEEHLSNLSDVFTVTHNANVKFINSVYPHDYVEIYASIVDISHTTFFINVEFMTRKRKSKEWITSATADFNFVLVDKESKKISRIPREIINEFKR